MRKYLYITFIFTLIIFSCKKEEEPKPLTNKPVFFVEMNLNNEVLKYYAGVDSFYMTTNFNYDTSNICSYISELSKLNCDNCQEKLVFKIRSNDVKPENSYLDINQSLEINKNYIYRNIVEEKLIYEFDFNAFAENENKVEQYIWDFGNNEIIISETSDINYFYKDTGIYNVCLSIQYKDETTTNICNEIHVFNKKNDLDNLDFIYTKDTKNSFELNFEPNISNADNYFWDFGDGKNSNNISPVHIFEEVGIYNVCLTITNNGISRKICKNIAIENIIYQVKFTGDLGINQTDNIEFIWDFGDGTTENGNINPIHSFNDTGTYDVCLEILEDNQIISKLCNEIIIGENCNTYFNYNILDIDSSASITQFNNLILEIGNLSVWNFGNSSVPIFNESNPIHKLSTYELNEVRLITLGENCKSSKAKNIYIPNEKDLYEMKFYPDIKLHGEIISSSWNFADETILQGQTENISHTFINQENIDFNILISFNLDGNPVNAPASYEINLTVPDTSQAFFICKRDEDTLSRTVFLDVFQDPLLVDTEGVYYKIDWGNSQIEYLDTTNFIYTYSNYGAYEITLQTFNSNDEVLGTFKKGMLITPFQNSPQVHVHYQLVNYSKPKFISNFNYQNDYIYNEFSELSFNYDKTIIDSTKRNLDLSQFTLEYTSKEGVFYSSYPKKQKNDSRFIILEIEDFKKNEQNQQTKKLTINFNCTLYSENDSLEIKNGQAIIGVAFPND